MPVLLMSAKTTAADQAAAFAAGANHWLGKPFTFADLLHTLLQHPPAAPAVWSAPLEAVAVQGRLASDTPSLPDALLALALERLAESGFGVAQWAAAAHLSDRQLRRRVSELTGYSPLHWLREQRLLRVRALISSGECQTLAAAGAQAGIDNPTYLYRLYRARFGED